MNAALQFWERFDLRHLQVLPRLGVCFFALCRPYTEIRPESGLDSARAPRWPSDHEVTSSVNRLISAGRTEGNLTRKRNELVEVLFAE